MRHRAIDDMSLAIGPRYQGRPVDEYEDDFIVTEIEKLRCQGIEAYVNKCLDHINFAWSRKEIGDMFEQEFGLDPMSISDAAVRKLQSFGSEGWGDAAARFTHQHGLRRLWNEFLRRSMLHAMREPRVDGGWGD